MTAMASQITSVPIVCSKKISKLRIIDLCEGNPPLMGGSPHEGPVTWKMFPFDDVIIIRMCSADWKVSLLGFARTWINGIDTQKYRNLHFRIGFFTMHLVVFTGLDAIKGNIYVNTLVAIVVQAIGPCIAYPILRSPLGRTGTMFAACFINATLVLFTILFQDGVCSIAHIP